MAEFAVIIPAAGQSRRMNQQEKKPFVEIDGKAVWLYSAEQMRRHQDVRQLIVVVSSEDVSHFNQSFAREIETLRIDIAIGGKERADSVENAIRKIRPAIDWIAVHDAARPCVSMNDIDAVFKKAQSTGAAILAAPIAGTIKKTNSDQRILETVSRVNMWEAQTPQAFRRDILEEAYEQRGEFQPTDEAQLVERNSIEVSIVEGCRSNMKITTPIDLELAQSILSRRKSEA